MRRVLRAAKCCAPACCAAPKCCAARLLRSEVLRALLLRRRCCRERCHRCRTCRPKSCCAPSAALGLLRSEVLCAPACCVLLRSAASRAAAEVLPRALPSRSDLPSEVLLHRVLRAASAVPRLAVRSEVLCRAALKCCEPCCACCHEGAATSAAIAAAPAVRSAAARLAAAKPSRLVAGLLCPRLLQMRTLKRGCSS